MNKNKTKSKWEQCPVCNGKFIHYAFSLENHRIVKCDGCGFMGINPQPTDQEIENIYSDNYFLLSNSKEGEKHSRYLKYTTAQNYLNLLEKYLKNTEQTLKGSRLLEIGIGFGDFLLAAKNRGCLVTGIEYSKSAIERARIKVGDSVTLIQGGVSNLSPTDRFDIIVFNDVLQNVRDPLNFMKTVYNALNKGGTIFCTITSLDSKTAKYQKTNWIEFKLEHLFYFNDKNARRLIAKSGFAEIAVLPARKTLSLKYIAAHFKAHPCSFWTPLLSIIPNVSPKKVLEYPFNIVASGINLMAKKIFDTSKRLKLTVVIAVFNEAPTVRTVIENVLSKEIHNCDIDLIIIESNSSDGSRKIVEEFQNESKISIILEDRPRGKGHAVRKGLSAATGDIILIQDADMEYDFEDYDSLIEILRDGGETFVLGSRHGGDKWKVRHFEGQPIVAFLANTVHWILTTIINILFNVRLTDPFTMFKVFRRSAIQDLTFDCNRFDFDYELLLKLIRKNHKPVEVPVNYMARSFKEGKKVRFFRDPPTWVWAIIKFRFIKL
jgi:ubiquinone/menaquinone biosynthesis C-methylase UbiE/CTP:molybdopterin cytidylyltransferase MocA